VGAAPASQLVVAVQPPGRSTPAADFGLVALAEDRFGNVDPHFGGKAVSVAGEQPGARHPWRHHRRDGQRRRGDLRGLDHQSGRQRLFAGRNRQRPSAEP